MKEDKKVVMNGGQNTKHAVSATHVERQVEKKARTTQTHRNRQIDKECA